MVIDFHTHTFPEKIVDKAVATLASNSGTSAFAVATVNGLLDSMQKSGVDRAVILPVATAPRQVEHINDASAQLNEEYADRGLFSLGAMHPDFSNYKHELARVQELGLKGIKLHSVYQQIDIDDMRTLQVLDRCAELGLIVVCHGGPDIGFPGLHHADVEKEYNALKAIPDVKIVLAHMGGWMQWDKALELLPQTNAMIDTAFSLGTIPYRPEVARSKKPEEVQMLTEERFLEMVRVFGADRILFGTDCPWSSQKAYVDAIRSYSLTAPEREAILHGNAERLLG